MASSDEARVVKQHERLKDTEEEGELGRAPGSRAYLMP